MLHSVDDMGLKESATGLKSLECSGSPPHLHCLSWHLSMGVQVQSLAFWNVSLWQQVWCQEHLCSDRQWTTQCSPLSLQRPECHPSSRFQMSELHRTSHSCLNQGDVSLLWSSDPGCPTMLVDWTEQAATASRLGPRAIHTVWVHKAKPNKDVWMTVMPEMMLLTVSEKTSLRHCHPITL